MALGLVPLAGKWLFLFAGSLLLAGVIALIPAYPPDWAWAGAPDISSWQWLL